MEENSVFARLAGLNQTTFSGTARLGFTRCGASQVDEDVQQLLSVSACSASATASQRSGLDAEQEQEQEQEKQNEVQHEIEQTVHKKGMF